MHEEPTSQKESKEKPECACGQDGTCAEHEQNDCCGGGCCAE